MTHWRPVSAGRREPAGTAIRTVDGVPVVFQYGQPIPSFDVRADVPASPPAPAAAASAAPASPAGGTVLSRNQTVEQLPPTPQS